MNLRVHGFSKLCERFASGTCLSSCCLPVKGEMHYTEPLPYMAEWDACIHRGCRDWWKGFMKYGYETVPRVMTYTVSDETVMYGYWSSVT
jgi:hypothetical protein